MIATTKYNKSQIMKRAWAIYKGNNPYSYSFSAALRRAWFVEKETLRYEAEKAERIAAEAKRSVREPALKTELSEAYVRGAIEYYSNALRGTYFGD